jgi:hypothetical protein
MRSKTRRLTAAVKQSKLLLLKILNFISITNDSEAMMLDSISGQRMVIQN